jgi:hypothetical protein
MKPDAGDGRMPRAASAALLVWALALHFVFIVSAGALWRDEANSVNQARLPSWYAVWQSLDHDTFPILYPAFLRLWSAPPAGGSDTGLRILGLLTGCGLVSSVWCAGRILGSKQPMVATLLISAAPLVISESDSLRPYGAALILLVWTYVALARYAGTRSKGWLATAALFSVLSVQTAYANAVQVGVMTLCAWGAGFARGKKRPDWAALIPGFVAALSLVVYLAPLRTAAQWAGLVRQSVDWRAFASRFVDGTSFVFAAVWTVAIAAAAAMRRGTRLCSDEQRRWCALVAFAALPVHLAFLWIQGVPPFPRYFLTALVPFALSLEVLGRGVSWRPHFALAAVLLTAVPAWTSLRQRRTNADAVGALLTGRAAERDLIVVSPWFLHPSFQRYYRGSAAWVTSPVLPPAPVMRYDFVKTAILDGSGDPGPAIDAALRRGGAVWLLTQGRYRSVPGAGAPLRPDPHVPPSGTDYVRFRSYWERGVEYALAAWCSEAERGPDVARRTWDEEDLLVVKFVKKVR